MKPNLKLVKEPKWYNGYLVKLSYTQSRGNRQDYDRQSEVASKWEALPIEHETGDNCGNVYHSLVYTRRTKSFHFAKDSGSYDHATTFSLSQVMPTALWMYRLIAMLGAKVETFDDPYKCIWRSGIRHKYSGKVIEFGEHKGSISIWMPEHSHTELDADFKQDLLELLNHLVSSKCLHPYDGTVAGSVA